jgi:ketosteroid isomerase-like protein
VASANVELVRSIYATWERGDFSSVAWADPKIEYVIAGGLSGGRMTLAAIADFWRDVLGAWEDFRMSADEFRELDEERVLVLVTYHGRGKTSGLDVGEMQGTGAAVFHIRDGRVIRFIHYIKREDALADLGLTPGAD